MIVRKQYVGPGFNVETRLSQLKHSAKARGINVNLDVNKYQILIDLGCHYCGSSLDKEKGYCLDRVDSAKGYVFSNVVGCCKICNRAKSDMDIDEFVQWLNRANTHTQKQIAKVREMVMSGMHISHEEHVELFNAAIGEQDRKRIKHVFSR